MNNVKEIYLYIFISIGRIKLPQPLFREVGEAYEQSLLAGH
jgi:hypothetical protein